MGNPYNLDSSYWLYYKRENKNYHDRDYSVYSHCSNSGQLLLQVQRRQPGLHPGLHLAAVVRLLSHVQTVHYH